MRSNTPEHRPLLPITSEVGVSPASTRSLFSIIAFLCAVLITTTSAQSLDFGNTNTVPKPGQGRAVLALADLLDTEAGHLDSNTPQHALRHYTSALLRAGEAAGSPGSEAVLSALTLAAHREELDTLLGACDHTTQAFLTRTLNDAEPSIRPRDLDLLLRDALAPVVSSAAVSCGWLHDDEHRSPTAIALGNRVGALEALLIVPALTDEASAALADFVELVAASLREPAYATSALAWSDLIIHAGSIFDDPPAWLDMPARDRLRADFSAATAGIFDDPESSRLALKRSGRILQIIAATDALDANTQSRALRDAANRLAAAADGDAKRDPAAVARIHETYFRALDLINADRDLPAPKALVRQIRPMLQPLLESHRRTAEAVVRVLPAILSEPDPMTKPGVLAAVHALSQTAEDLRIPSRLSALLSTWTDDPSRPPPSTTREPLATRTMGPMSERIRALGVALGREDRSADALDQLRSLSSFSRLLPVFPCEADLRANAHETSWRHVTGDQADRLLFLLDEARAAWLRSHATDQFADRRNEDETRVLALADLLPLLCDGSQVLTMRYDWSRDLEPTINAHPGWELTRPGLDALADGLGTRLAEFSALAARNDDHERLLAHAESIRADYAAALLCAQLNATAQQLHTSDCTLADELGRGSPPPDAWLAPHRHTLAVVCRSAYEAAAAEGKRRDMFIAHANRTAHLLLESFSETK